MYLFRYTAEVIIVARCFALTCICCSTVNLIIIGVSFLTVSTCNNLKIKISFQKKIYLKLLFKKNI